MDFAVLIIWTSPHSFLGALEVIFHVQFHFFDENHICKQNSSRWDAAFCGVPSGAILFAYVGIFLQSEQSELNLD